MQRHRAGRLAVLLSLSKIDARPDGVARTACINPDAATAKDCSKGGQRQRTPSTVHLMAPVASENSVEGISENEESSQNLRPTLENSRTDSGLEMRRLSIDVTQQTADILRIEALNGECRSVSDDSGILVGGGSPNNGSAESSSCVAAASSGAGVGESCAAICRRNDTRISGTARLPSNASSSDHLGKSTHHGCVCNFCLFDGLRFMQGARVLICRTRLRFELAL